MKRILSIIYWLTIFSCLLLIVGCEYTRELPQNSDVIEEGIFVLGKSSYKGNRLLVGKDMEISLEELQGELRKSAAQLIKS